MLVIEKYMPLLHKGGTLDIHEAIIAQLQTLPSTEVTTAPSLSSGLVS